MNCIIRLCIVTVSMAAISIGIGLGNNTTKN